MCDMFMGMIGIAGLLPSFEWQSMTCFWRQQVLQGYCFHLGASLGHVFGDVIGISLVLPSQWKCTF
jgi:ABC-type phosphate transport system auxiliary subunit